MVNFDSPKEMPNSKGGCCFHLPGPASLGLLLLRAVFANQRHGILVSGAASRNLMEIPAGEGGGTTHLALGPLL